jgi:exosortase A-associated hydrolase 1
MTPLVFACGGARLAGQLHPATGTTGVLVVAGGAQTRVGAHRMFVDLARHVAAAGAPVFRFDRRGVGDSDGDNPGFERLAADITAAAGAFRAACPHVARIVGVGHCDGAAALALAPHDFAGLVLLNLWTVDGDTPASTPAVRAHYRRRLLQAASWRRLLTGQVDVFGAIGSLLAARRAPAMSTLARRIAEALDDAAVPRLLVFSGRDATAQAARPFASQLGTNVWLADADHSFTDPAHLAAVADQIVDFIGQIDREA